MTCENPRNYLVFIFVFLLLVQDFDDVLVGAHEIEGLEGGLAPRQGKKVTEHIPLGAGRGFSGFFYRRVMPPGVDGIRRSYLHWHTLVQRQLEIFDEMQDIRSPSGRKHDRVPHGGAIPSVHCVVYLAVELPFEAIPNHPEALRSAVLTDHLPLGVRGPPVVHRAGSAVHVLAPQSTALLEYPGWNRRHRQVEHFCQPAVFGRVHAVGLHILEGHEPRRLLHRTIRNLRLELRLEGEDLGVLGGRLTLDLGQASLGVAAAGIEKIRVRENFVKASKGGCRDSLLLNQLLATLGLCDFLRELAGPHLDLTKTRK